MCFVVYVVPVNDISNSDGDVISLMLCISFFMPPRSKIGGHIVFGLSVIPSFSLKLSPC